MLQKVVAYYRVSRDSQGADGLGIAGQKTDVGRFVSSNGYDLVGEYSEVETGKKHTLDNRPKLRDAIAHARRSGALLVVAKLDRLLRSTVVHSLLKTSGIRFVACDNPHANELTIDILAAVAANEVREISSRTKKALAEKKAEGFLLGAARPGAHQITREAGAKGAVAGSRTMRQKADEAYTDLIPALQAMKASGLSLGSMAARLDADGHTTRRGKPWNAMQVSRVLARA